MTKSVGAPTGHALAYSATSAQAASLVVDSGATVHMTQHRGLLHDFCPCKGWGVTGIDDRSLPIWGSGTMRVISSVDGVWRELEFPNSLYVQDMTVTLVSVPALTAAGASVSFTAHACEVSQQGELRLRATWTEQPTS